MTGATSDSVFASISSTDIVFWKMAFRIFLFDRLDRIVLQVSQIFL